MSLGWKQRPLAELVRISWPIAVSSLSYSAMTLVDTMLIGHVGRGELAGVGLAGIAAFVLLCFSMGMLRAANTLVAQAIGADRPQEARALLGAAIASAAAMGVVTLVGGQIVAELLPRLAATATAGAAARTYMRIRTLGAPLVLVFVALREVRYGQGQSRAPMAASIVANLINVALAYLFIFVLGRGVAGAATATVIAHAAELGFLAVTQARRGFGLRAWGRPQLRALWRMGLPVGLQFALEVGSFALLSFLISMLSEVEMAAHQIAIQIIHFSFLPAFAIGEGAAVLAGQAVGADRDDLVRRVARLATGVAVVYTGVCTVLLAIGAPWLARAFTADPTVGRVAVGLLHIAAVFQMIDAANMVARGTLRGAGDVRYAATVGIVTSWLFTPPLCWLLGYRMGLGARGGWLGLCLEITVGAALLWHRIESRRWLSAAAQARAHLRTAGGADAALA
jgi:MATE family multidrug resistance protein